MKALRTAGTWVFRAAIIVAAAWLIGEHCRYNGEYGDPEYEECHYGFTLEAQRIARFLWNSLSATQ